MIMERLLAGLALVALASFASIAPAAAATTREFLELCDTFKGEQACVDRMDEVLQAAIKEEHDFVFCIPSDLRDRAYIWYVTHWIAEQPSLDMNQDDAISIKAALKALYVCKQTQGQPQ